MEEILLTRISEKGIKKKWLAEQMGLSEYGLRTLLARDPNKWKFQHILALREQGLLEDDEPQKHMGDGSEEL